MGLQSWAVVRQNPFCPPVGARAREYCSTQECYQNAAERGDPWDKTRSTLACKAVRGKGW